MDDAAKRKRIEDVQGLLSRFPHGPPDDEPDDDTVQLAEDAEEVARKKRKVQQDVQAKTAAVEKSIHALEANLDSLNEDDGSLVAERVRAKLAKLKQAKLDWAAVIMSTRVGDDEAVGWDNISSKGKAVMQCLLRERVRARVGVLQGERDELKRALSQREQQIEDQETQIGWQKTQIQDQQRRIHALQKTEADQAGQIEGLEKEVRTLREHDDKSAQELRDVRAHNKKLEETVAGLEGRIRGLETSVEELDNAATYFQGRYQAQALQHADEMREADSQLEEAVERAELAEGNLQVQAAKAGRLTEKLQDKKNKLDSISSELAEAKDDRARAGAQMEHLETVRQVQTMQEALDSARIVNLELALSDAAQDRMHLDQQLDDMRRQRDEQSQRRERLAQVLEQDRQQSAADAAVLATHLDAAQEQLAAAQEARLQTARFLASQSGCSEPSRAQDEAWLVFVEATAQAEQPLSGAARPWRILEAWLGDADHADHTDSASPPPLNLLDACCRLYGHRLDGRTDNETIRLLGSVRDWLCQAPAGQAAPVVLVSAVLDGFFRVGGYDEGCMLAQWCLLSAWSLAGVLVARQENNHHRKAALAHLRTTLDLHLATGPLDPVRGLAVDAQLEPRLAALPRCVLDESEGRLASFPDARAVVFCDDGEEARRPWVFLLDLDGHSIRMVRRSLGQIGLGSLTYRDVTLSFGTDDLAVFDFVMRCF